MPFLNILHLLRVSEMRSDNVNKFILLIGVAGHIQESGAGDTTVITPINNVVSMLIP